VPGTVRARCVAYLGGCIERSEVGILRTRTCTYVVGDDDFACCVHEQSRRLTYSTLYGVVHTETY
jgi:hypothetical protein